MARTDGKEIDQILKSNGLKTLDEYNKSLSAAGFLSTGFKKLDDLICENGGLPQGKISEAAGMHCLGANTMITCRYNEAGKITKKRSISGLYKRTHGKKTTWDAGKITGLEVRCLNESTGLLEWTPAKVMKSGVKVMSHIKYGNDKVGYKTMNATPEHRFLTGRGWKQLKDMVVGDIVYMNGKRMLKMKGIKDLNDYEIFVKYHPSASKKVIEGRYTYYRMAEHRFVYEAHRNGMTPSEYRDLLNNYDGREIWTIPKGMHIHHKDHNHMNNDINNLELLTPEEHSLMHKNNKAFKQVGVIPVEIVEIHKSWHKEMTYDIECLGDHHNFIANDIVVHNSVGKSMLAKYIASQPDVKALYIETEGALDPRKEYNFDLVQENVLENIWGVVNSAVEKDLYDLIVIDSVSMATTNQELDDDNDPSMNTNMSRAKILTKWIRSLTKELTGKKVAVLFINHLKQKVGVLYTDFYTPGGQAIPYAASLRMFLYSTKTSLIKKDGEIIGQKVRVKLEKNRFGEKTKEVEIKMLYKEVM